MKGDDGQASQDPTGENFDVPLLPLGNADRQSNGRRFGELHVSKGAVVWVGKD